MARLFKITLMVLIITCQATTISNSQTRNPNLNLIDTLLQNASLPNTSPQLKDSLFNEASIQAQNLNEVRLLAQINFNWGVEKFRANQFNEAMQLFSKAENFYYKTNDYKSLRKVFEEKGYCYQRIGKIDSAYIMFKSDLALSKEIQNDSTIALANTNLGHVEWRRGNFSEAIIYFEKALLIRKKLKLNEEIASSLNSIGSVYWKRGQYAMALKNFLESLRIREEFKDTLGKIISLNNIGAIYQKIEHLKQAEEYFLIGLSYSKKAAYSFGEAYSNYNLGLLYAKQNEHKKAIEFFRQSLNISTEIADLNLEMMTIIYLGESYEALNDLDTALEYFNSSLRKSKQYSDSFVSAKAFNCIARIYFKKKQSLDKVIELLGMSIEISESESIQEINLDNYSLYYQLYQRIGNDSKSLEYYKKRSEIKEKLISEKLINNITDMLIRYEIQQSEIEIDLLKKEKDLQSVELENEKYFRNLIIVIALSALVLLIILIIFYRNKVNYSKEISRQKELLESLNTQLLKRNEELQSSNNTKNKLFSLISHDLRNPVGVLLNYSSLLAKSGDSLSEKDRQEIYQSVEQSTESIVLLIDDLLNWAQAQTGTLRLNENAIDVDLIFHNVLTVYHNFAKLKNIKLEKVIHQEIKVNADQHLLDAVLRNLISNALKFTPNNGNVSLKAEIADDKCKITVADGGVGMSNEKLKKVLGNENNNPSIGTGGEIGTGLGLSLTIEFLKLHNTKLEAISEKSKGTNFFFYLPLKE